MHDTYANAFSAASAGLNSTICLAISLAAKRHITLLMLVTVLERVCFTLAGFYGRPWTPQQREELVSNMSAWGMNLYMYAPKVINQSNRECDGVRRFVAHCLYLLLSKCSFAGPHNVVLHKYSAHVISPLNSLTVHEFADLM